MRDSVAKMIDTDDICGLNKYLTECNRVILSPVASSFSTHRAFCLKMEVLRNWYLSRNPRTGEGRCK